MGTGFRKLVRLFVIRGCDEARKPGVQEHGTAKDSTAATVKTGLSGLGLNVLFYPHNQEELVGTDGIESMRAPLLDARVNVVLFREQYGNTPWTRVELSAIEGQLPQYRVRFPSVRSTSSLAQRF